MKTIKTRFILCICLSFLVSTAFSQILNVDKIRKRAAERAEQRTEDGVNKRVDKIVDGLFGGLDKGAKKTKDAVNGGGSESSDATDSQSSSNSEEDVMKKLGGILGNFKSAPEPNTSYDFESSYIMKMVGKDEKGEETLMRMKYFFTHSPAMGIKYLEMQMDKEKGPLMDFTIMDFDKNGIYNFMTMEGKKTMMSLSLDSKGTEKVNTKLDETIEKVTYTKTGETKTIIGYKCDGYLMEQDKAKMTVWISQEKVPVIADYYKTFSKMNQNSAKDSKVRFQYNRNPEIMKFAAEGRVVLGMDSEEQGSEMHMEVEEIKPSDQFSFNTSGYENMMDLNEMMKASESKKGDN